MELAGVFSTEGGIRPELLKYVFIKGQDASAQQSGQAAFCVFNKSQHTVTAGTASAEGNAQAVKAVPDHTTPKAPAVKQTAVTDFFSPRRPTSSAELSGPPRRASALPPFITPCPSVRLAEVPAVFQAQPECVVEDYLDPSRPLYGDNVSTPLPQPSITETGSPLANATFVTPSPGSQHFATKEEGINFKKLSRRYSEPSIVKVWQSRSIADFRSAVDPSNNETSLGGLVQHSESSSTASPMPDKEKMPTSNCASPPEVTSANPIRPLHVEDMKTEAAEQDAEGYWIEKDKERLEVIANMEKTMAEKKRELASTVTALKVVSDAKLKLQAELEKKTASVSEMEEDLTHLSHALDAAEMDNELLVKDLAYSRRDRQRQNKRAQEVMTLLEADPSKITIATLLQDKAKDESRLLKTLQKKDSEIESLTSQLEERCDSVAKLTANLSRVADFDRWDDIKKEFEDIRTRVDNLPDQLQASWLECEKWKGQYEEAMLDQVSLEEELQNVKDSNEEAIRELRWSLMNEAAASQRSLNECLKQVFERMIRCSLLLEASGFAPFDRKHRAICEKMLQVTGKDYQKPLLAHYDEHDIYEEFRETTDDRGLSSQRREDNGWGSQNCEDVVMKTGGKDFASTSTSSTNSGSGAYKVSPDSTSVAEGVEVFSAPDPSQGQNEADLPVGDTERLPVQEVDNTYEDDAEYSNIYNNTADDADSSDGENNQESAGTPGDAEEKPEQVESSEPLRSSEAAGVASPSTAGKGSIWEDVSFAAAKDAPFSFQAGSTTDLGPESNEKPPGLEPFGTSQPLDFNFGQMGSPVSLTGPSPSFPPPFTQSASGGIFSFKAQVPPSLTIQEDDEVMPNTETAKEKAPEHDSETGSLRQTKKPKTSQLREQSAPDPETPDAAPSFAPSTPTRNQKRAAKREKKAAKKAEQGAKNAKARERRRVQQVLMMRS